MSAERIEHIPLQPAVTATVEEVPPVWPGLDQELLSHYEDYYLQQSPGGGGGPRTIYIRRAFQEVQGRQRRRNVLVIALMATLLVTVGSYAFYQHSQAGKQQQLAEDLFYAMKSIELDLAKADAVVLARKGGDALDQMHRSRTRRRALEDNYD